MSSATSSSSFREDVKMPLLHSGNDVVVGREKELEALESTYERVKEKNSSCCILLQGESGSGKSSLIRRLEQTVDAEKDFFVSAKFSQFETCSTALVDSMTELLLYLQHNKIIQQAVKEALSADEICTLQKWMPSIQLVVPKNDTVQDEEHVITTEHSFQCFKLALRSFLTAVCSRAILVMVIDDYQWADEASQQVVDFLLNDDKSTNLLVMVSSRQEIATLRAPSWPCVTLVLGSLSTKDVNEIVSSVLEMRQEATTELSAIVYQKTGGNPHFCIQFLETLHRQGLLTFNFARGTWDWNLEGIQTNTNVSANVVDLLLDKIQSMSVDLQVTLVTAACLGFTFDSAILEEILITQSFFETLISSISGEHDPKLNNAWLDRVLQEAQKAGLIETSSGDKYKFSHDRIQQCAFGMFPSVHHEKLGCIVFEMSQSACAQEWMVYTSVDLLTNSSVHSRQDFARLCLDAARRASKRFAYISSADYADKGLDCLSWDDNYELRLELANVSADTRYAYGNFERSSEVVSDILKNARSVADKLRAYTVYVAILGARQDLTGARIAATKFLREIGVRVPKKANGLQVALALSKTKRMLNGRKPEDIKKLPIMTDRTMIEAMRLLFRLTLYDWRSGEANLMAIHNMTMLQLTLKHGMGVFGPVATALYGCVVSLTGNLQEAYEWGSLTLELAKDPSAKEGFSHAVKVVHLVVCHLKRPLYESLEPMLTAFHVAKEVGDVEIAAYCLQAHAMFSVVVGMPLDSLEKEMQSYVDFCRQFRQEAVLMEILPFYQLTLNLLGRSDNPLVLSGEAMVEQEFVHQVVCSNEGLGSVLLLRYARIFLLYLLDELELAEEERLNLDRKNDFVSTYFMKYNNYFICGMICLGMARKRNARKNMKNSRFYVRQLEEIARAGSPNFVPMLKLLKAEEQALKGTNAMSYYNTAIAMASRSGFRLITAIACERAGAYMLECGNNESAIDYIQRSRNEFMEYGAKSKLAQMEEKYKTVVDLKGTDTTMPSKSSARLQPHLVESWKQRVGK